MDCNDINLMYMPYCIYRKIVSFFDEVIVKKPDFLYEYRGQKSRSFSSGAALFEQLTTEKWTCQDLKDEISKYKDDDILNQFLQCVNGLNGIKGCSQEQTQSLNIALQDRVTELEFENKTLKHSLNDRDSPELLLAGAPGPSRYQMHSPIQLREYNSDEVEFG